MRLQRINIKKSVLVVLMSGIVFALLLCRGYSGVTSNAAIDSSSTVQYSCKDSVWYILDEGVTAHVTTGDGSAFDISYEWVYEDLDIGKAVLDINGSQAIMRKGKVLSRVYLSVRNSILLMAVQMRDEAGEYAVCFYNGKASCKISGSLNVDSDSVSVTKPLLAGFCLRTEIDAESLETSEAVEAEDSTYVYRLKRPLIVSCEADETSQRSTADPEGEQVTVTDCICSEDKEYYFVQGQNFSGWVACEDRSLLYQLAEFSDVFYGGNENEQISYEENCESACMANNSCLCEIYLVGASRDFCFSDYCKAFDERITLHAPSALIFVGCTDTLDTSGKQVIIIQYCKMIENDENISYTHVCKLYTLNGTQLILVTAEGFEDGELPVRLLEEDYNSDAYLEGYTDEKITHPSLDGSIEINGVCYKLKGDKLEEVK